MPRYDVTIDVDLAEGATAESAEIDPNHLTTHEYEVDAATEADAEEAALDEFHSEIPIGVLEAVEITASARACDS